MLSYWEKTYWNENVDLCIVGSGLVGLFTALHAATLRPGIKITIVERSSLPLGASTKNAGFACFATIGEILDDLRTFDENTVIDTIRMRWEGLQLLKNLVQPEMMHYEPNGGYELLSEKEFDQYYPQYNYINQLIEEAIKHRNTITLVDQSISKLFHEKCFFNALEGQLNPVLLVNHLIKQCLKHGINILWNFDLQKYENVGDHYKLIASSNMSLNSKKIIFCTNAFTSRFFPDMDIKPARNQVLVVTSPELVRWNSCFHFNKGYIYFRNVDGKLLIGGARDVALQEEQTAEFGINPLIQEYLLQFISDKLEINSFQIHSQWSGIIATGRSKKPIIDEVESNVYTAVRLGGMGVAIGAGVGKAVAELALKD